MTGRGSWGLCSVGKELPSGSSDVRPRRGCSDVGLPAWPLEAGGPSSHLAPLPFGPEQTGSCSFRGAFVGNERVARAWRGGRLSMWGPRGDSAAAGSDPLTRASVPSSVRRVPFAGHGLGPGGMVAEDTESPGGTFRALRCGAPLPPLRVLCGSLCADRFHRGRVVPQSLGSFFHFCDLCVSRHCDSSVHDVNGCGPSLPRGR